MSGHNNVRDDEQTSPKRVDGECRGARSEKRVAYWIIIRSFHQEFACHVVQSRNIGRVIGRAVDATRWEVNPTI